MKLLLHVCCGPCTIYPLQRLRQQGFGVKGFFFNPNIHPYREFRRRLTSLKELSTKVDLEVISEEEYGLTDYLQQVVFHEKQRCTICYRMRLEATAQRAAQTGADAFSTTLLYSRYQKHEGIRKVAEDLAEQYKVPFFYEDFREGWQEGIEQSIALDLYRQPYCGCIYSEQERYDKRLRKKIQKKEHKR